MRSPKLKEMAIKNAISSWTRALNGDFNWSNDFAKGKSKEYIQSQIDYFKNLKL